MAYYAALASLVQLLEEISHPDRFPNFFLDKQQISSLFKKFSVLQELLQDYSPTDKNAADFLERRIRDAAYQAQDIIESHISNQNHPEDKTHGVQWVFRHLKSAFRKAPQQLKPQRFEELSLDDVGKEYQYVENVKEEVDSIMEEMRMLKESHRALEDLQLNSYFADSTESSNQAPSSRNTMVGFDDHLTTIKGQLCGESSKLEVVSIVGMGGIGKTTLARNILDDELVVYHFYCCAWVTVSQDYHVQKVFQGIIDSLNISKELKGEGEGVLAEYIYKHLKGRRYLIIMDDVWDTKVWDDIKRILPDDSNGSRVIITTRLSRVAFYAGKSEFIHQMQFLNKDESWNLFCEKAFCPPALVNIGRLIANNCGGLPLAIVVIAGLLSKVDKTRYDWEEIARNTSSAAAENDEDFSKILSLSYDHLPHHLKPCFLYLGGFPEDHEIPTSRLIKLWVAEGFTKPIESKSLEEAAEKYLQDLVDRSLVLITKKTSNGKFKFCSMHDVLRDLCKQRVRFENFFNVIDKRNYFDQEAMRNARHLCLISRLSNFGEAGKCVSHIRSILCFAQFLGIFPFALGFKLLRVLDALEISLRSFPVEIVELLHLRYLALHGDAVPVPRSISKLQNLQTLILGQPEKYTDLSFLSRMTLPFEIWRMPQLRHVMVYELRISPFPFVARISGEASILENLQTLSGILNFKFTKRAIKMIPNIRKLKVMCASYVAPHMWREFCLHNLIHLHQLEILTIWFCYVHIPINILEFVNPLPKSFAFPLKLRKLSLCGCKLPWKDLTVVGNTNYLVLIAFSITLKRWLEIENK